MSLLFFFNDTATTEIYTLSLHDALPIWHRIGAARALDHRRHGRVDVTFVRVRLLHTSRRLFPPAAIEDLAAVPVLRATRSEEHTSELQSRQYLVCRLLLEKKKNKLVVEY